MISCTEFIPFYSEVFKYLESKKGLRVDYIDYYQIGRAHV